MTSKVFWASRVLSGKCEKSCGGRGTTFCEELRANLGGCPGSSLTEMPPPTFSVLDLSLSSPLRFPSSIPDGSILIGVRDADRDLIRDGVARSSLVEGTGYAACESGSLAPPPLGIGASVGLPDGSNFIAVTASATVSD
jgi:hypothetical protein